LPEQKGNERDAGSADAHRERTRDCVQDRFLYLPSRSSDADNPEFDPLMGQVEVDETYIGGKNKNRHWDKNQGGSGTAGKIPVIGAISRKGNIICKMIENTDTETLTKFVTKTVSSKVDLIATDEHSGYRYLKWAPYPHQVVSHSQGE
jgi:hypothetical protein